MTVLKVAGAAGDWVSARLRAWAATRRAADPRAWGSEDWPAEVRREADGLADRLRAHPAEPPVVYYAEWADLWSTGDVLDRWLTPPPGAEPVQVWGDRYQVFGYFLPDGGALAEHLAGAGPHQYPESEWLVRRLAEAVGSWDKLYDRAILLVLRGVLGPSVLDEELTESFRAVPAWLSEPGRSDPPAG